ncbi:MAG: hypothetical protein MZV64_67905 [Ignavibacteriales bacterium]|nr:hypothetical protein [Ignavibacteriales bacterium]
MPAWRFTPCPKWPRSRDSFSSTLGRPGETRRWSPPSGGPWATRRSPTSPGPAMNTTPSPPSWDVPFRTSVSCRRPRGPASTRSTSATPPAPVPTASSSAAWARTSAGESRPRSAPSPRRPAGPSPGRSEAPGTLEGGDIVWLDSRTAAVGHGYRTNGEGIRQFRDLVAAGGREVFEVPFPTGTARATCSI